MAESEEIALGELSIHSEAVDPRRDSVTEMSLMHMTHVWKCPKNFTAVTIPEMKTMWTISSIFTSWPTPCLLLIKLFSCMLKMNSSFCSDSLPWKRIYERTPQHRFNFRLEFLSWYHHPRLSFIHNNHPQMQSFRCAGLRPMDSRLRTSRLVGVLHRLEGVPCWLVQEMQTCPQNNFTSGNELVRPFLKSNKLPPEDETPAMSCYLNAVGLFDDFVHKDEVCWLHGGFSTIHEVVLPIKRSPRFKWSRCQPVSNITFYQNSFCCCIVELWKVEVIPALSFEENNGLKHLSSKSSAFKNTPTRGQGGVKTFKVARWILASDDIFLQVISTT